MLNPRSDSRYKVGFVGAGKMAQGLATGFLSAGILKPEEILVTAPSTRNSSYFKNELGIDYTSSSNDLASCCRIVFFAVKPHVVPEVLDGIRYGVVPDQLFVSVAAGVSLEILERHMNSDAKIIRAMPNMPVQVQAGVTVFTRGKNVTHKFFEDFQNLMQAVGICQEVPETMIDAVTGMVGSASAFVFLMMQALADGGVKMGIPRHLANDFALQTFLGSAKLVQDSKKHPAILMEEVASPGGTTIHGLHQLEKDGMRAAVMNAVEAATKRAKELDPNN